jgi:hypothetical protein
MCQDKRAAFRAGEEMNLQPAFGPKAKILLFWLTIRQYA